MGVGEQLFKQVQMTFSTVFPVQDHIYTSTELTTPITKNELRLGSEFGGSRRRKMKRSKSFSRLSRRLLSRRRWNDSADRVGGGGRATEQESRERRLFLLTTWRKRSSLNTIGFFGVPCLGQSLHVHVCPVLGVHFRGTPSRIQPFLALILVVKDRFLWGHILGATPWGEGAVKVHFG